MSIRFIVSRNMQPSKTERLREVDRIVRDLRHGCAPDLKEYYDDVVQTLRELILNIDRRTERKSSQTRAQVEAMLRQCRPYRQIVARCHVGKDFIYKTKKRLAKASKNENGY